MLAPKKMKFRKQHRGKVKGKAYRGSELAFGNFGLQALEAGRITARQIEAARIAMTRSIKRGGQVWIQIFPDKPVTRKPAEVRMGKGKGSVEYYVALIKPGRILYEMNGVEPEVAKAALTLAGSKLPIKTRVLSKDKDPWSE